MHIDLITTLWTLSPFVCLFIARRRHVKSTFARAVPVLVLGPLAIPYALVARPEPRHHA